MRLKRARRSNRAQYLRIQAVHLAESKRTELLQVAVSLCDRVIAEFPDDSQLSLVHSHRANCLLQLGDISEGIDGLRAALDIERQQPNVRSEAWLDLGWTAVEHGLSEIYDECLAVLTEFLTDIPFPIQRYRYHTIRAVIASHQGEYRMAATEADQALEMAGLQHSGYGHHSRLGLVGDSNPALHTKLLRLAAG